LVETVSQFEFYINSPEAAASRRRNCPSKPQIQEQNHTAGFKGEEVALTEVAGG
jgi:hypothetical protein